MAVKILYVDAFETSAGDTARRDLEAGLAASDLVRQEGLEVHAYDLFRNERRYIRSAYEWVRDRGPFDAIVLSSSEKHGGQPDPWMPDCLDGLARLLNVTRDQPQDWDGPPAPVVALGFSFHALALLFNAELSELGARSGPVQTRALPRGWDWPCCRGGVPMAVAHIDHIVRLPTGFHAVLTSESSTYEGIAHDTWPVLGLQGLPDDANFWKTLAETTIAKRRSRRITR